METYLFQNISKHIWDKKRSRNTLEFVVWNPDTTEKVHAINQGCCFFLRYRTNHLFKGPTLRKNRFISVCFFKQKNPGKEKKVHLLLLLRRFPG